MDRRHVDWDQSEARQRVVVHGAMSPELGWLVSAFDEMTACGEGDAILKRAVELARRRVGLSRAAIFLRDEPHGVMRGSWGSDLEGNLVDEHFVTFDIPPGDREFYESAARSGIYWTVVEDAPLVVHSKTATRVVGHGWVCCTPIRSASGLLGIMFNDAGLTGAPVDVVQQSRAAVLCSLVGTALHLARRRGQAPGLGDFETRSPIVGKAAQLLAGDPGMTGDELGARLQLSGSRVARLFKSEMGVSLVEFRNRLRLERFTALLDQNGDNLLDAALAAGFGSYSQFHRVFRAHRGTTPGRFLSTRRRK